VTSAYTTNANVTVSTVRRFRAVADKVRIDWTANCAVHGDLTTFTVTGPPGVDDTSLESLADSAARNHIGSCRDSQ
jgi:hypothetical protein